MTLRDYQRSAVEWLVVHPRGLVQVAAAGGKTIIAAFALRERRIRFGDARFPAWLAPTKETAEQARAALKTVGFKPDDVKVCCPHPGLSLHDRDFLIYDEAKHCRSEMNFALASQVPNRWGFDATPFKDGDWEANARISQLFDNQLFSISRDDLKAHLANAKVVLAQDSDAGVGRVVEDQQNRLYAKLKRFSRLPEDKIRVMALWQSLQTYGFRQNRARNARALQFARHHRDQSTLILASSVDHAYELNALLPGSAVVHSKLDKKARGKIIAAFKDGSLKTLLGVTLLDEGFDAPRAEVLILLGGGKSSQKAEQRTARVLRPFDGKDCGLIYDFLDPFHSVAAKHAMARLAVYRRLKYQITTYDGSPVPNPDAHAGGNALLAGFGLPMSRGPHRPAGSLGTPQIPA